MSTVLNAVFLANQASLHDLDLLEELGLDHLDTWTSPINFFGTNKQSDFFYIGSTNNHKIICNYNLASKAFDEKNNPFLKFKNFEIASFIYYDQAGIHGFSLIQNGKLIRYAMSVDTEVYDDFGEPIPEEFEIDDDEILCQADIDEILEEEGEEELNLVLRSTKISMAADNLVKRYLGSSLFDYEKTIWVQQYR